MPTAHFNLMVFTAAVLVAACRPAGGGSPVAPVPEAEVAPAAAVPTAEKPSVATTNPRLLDLSGSYGNRVELEGNLGLGSATFPFAPDATGTLLLIGFDYDFGTCQRSTVDARVFLQSFDEEGRLLQVVELEQLRPLRAAKAHGYQVLVQLKTLEECHGAAVSVAIRYFAPREINAGTHTSVATGTSVGGSTDGSTDGGVDEPDAPTRCPPLADRATDLPSSLKGGFVLHGRRSIKDGCEALFTWRVQDNMMSLDPPACSLPTAKFTMAASLLKALDVRPDYDFNLFWLRVADAGRAEVVRQALEDGKTIDLIAGPDDCPALPASPTTLVMQSDVDLALFSSDPRDACLPTGETSAMLDVNPAASSTFQVSYQYGAADVAHFSWKLQFSLPASQATGSLANGTRARIYNRRVRAFVSDWLPLTGDPRNLTLELKDPSVLHRVLPYQAELEILLAPADSAASCPVAYVLPYHLHFMDSTLNSRFVDGTSSGRSRHLLKEEDLPL